MKNIISTLIILLCFTLSIQAQNALAKIEYAEAETDFQKGNYAESLEHLETVKNMLGSTNAKVMYLEVVATDKLLDANTLLTISQEEAIKNPSIFMTSQAGTTPTRTATSANASSSIMGAIGLVASTVNSSYSAQEQQNSIIKIISSKDIEAYQKGMAAVKELSSFYIENFEQDVPIEKLKEVYSINKKHTGKQANLADFAKGMKAFENDDYTTAKNNFKNSCLVGDIGYACILLGQMDTYIEQKEFNSKLNTIEGNDNVKIHGMWNKPIELQDFSTNVLGKDKTYVRVDGMDRIHLNRRNIQHFAVRQGNSYGAVSKKLKIEIPIMYEDILTLPDAYKGNSIVKLNGKYGLVDEAHKETMPLEYDDMGTWGYGLLWVEKDGKFGLTKRSNKIILPIEYEFLGYLKDKDRKDRLMRIKRDGKWGWIDINGNIVIEPQYDTVKEQTKGFWLEGDTVEVTKDGRGATIILE